MILKLNTFYWSENSESHWEIIAMDIEEVRLKNYADYAPEMTVKRKDFEKAIENGKMIYEPRLYNYAKKTQKQTK